MIFSEPLTIEAIVQRAYATARSKGWHDEPRTFGDHIALIHCELSEALEEFRNGMPLNLTLRDGRDKSDGPPYKPEGIPIELADVVIRIGDMCGQYGIDLETAITEKLIYNQTRKHRHGGKAL